MAFFTKKTWVARQGTGLNKFSINGATPVTVVNQPDTVTEQGDALSATNLNNLEQRIYDAFDAVADDIQEAKDNIEDIEDGTTVVKKAEQDANGNEITTTYETKADASELKSAIDNNSQRIENLEVAVSGSLVQTNTDATQANTKVITNANEILPWAILKRAGTRSVAFNQAIVNGNFANNNTGWSENAVSYSVLNNVGTVSFSVTNANLTQGVSLISGHKYLLAGSFKTNGTISFYIDGYSTNAIPSDGAWHTITQIIDASSTATKQLRILNAGSGSAIADVKNIMLVDLTAMGMDALTADQFRALFPASYYPTDTGHIYDLNPEGFLVRGVNLWDEEWEVGTYDSSDGLPRNGGWYDDNCCRSKNYIPVSPNTTYQVNNFWVEFFDGNKNYLHDYVQGNVNRTITFTTPTNCVYVLLTSASAYGNTYKYDTQFCLDSLPTSVKTVYHPYDGRTVETPQIADGHYVNENCYDYVENAIEDGIVKGKKHTVVGSVDLGTLDWAYHDSPLSRFSSTVIDDIKVPVNDGVIANISCGLYLVGSVNETATIDKTIGAGMSKKLYFKDLSKTGADLVNGKAPWLNGVMLYYEIATETITDVAPFPNIPCENGTSVTAITPQTDLVNAIDVPSTIAYMTKIAS